MALASGSPDTYVINHNVFLDVTGKDACHSETIEMLLEEWDIYHLSQQEDIRVFDLSISYENLAAIVSPHSCRLVKVMEGVLEEQYAPNGEYLVLGFTKETIDKAVQALETHSVAMKVLETESKVLSKEAQNREGKDRESVGDQVKAVSADRVMSSETIEPARDVEGKGNDSVIEGLASLSVSAKKARKAESDDGSKTASETSW